MKFKLNVILLLLYCSFSFGQMQDYSYRSEIKGIKDQWHKIELPDEIFGKVSKNMSDIRVFGITSDLDTIEAAYLLRRNNEKIIKEKVSFKTLNSTFNKKGYFYTFEIPKQKPINQIDLNFKEQNFDWEIKLEGSNEQKDWFTILDEYRILSIKNKSTDYRFTKLNFADSKYRYYRLRINSKENPELNDISITRNNIDPGHYRDYPVLKKEIIENKKRKQTEIELELGSELPVSNINIKVAENYDFYRHLTITYLSDSIKTDNVWKPVYYNIVSGILNSLEENTFAFKSKTTKKLKLIVQNYDNQPLTYNDIIVKGAIHELIVRFNQPANYYLTYGNKKAVFPNYDIKRFEDRIPETLTKLKIGKKEIIKSEDSGFGPLFKNKVWLWAVICIMILLLGWFSISMIRNK